MMLRSFAITTLCALALPSLALATPPQDDPAQGTSPEPDTSPEVGSESLTGPIDVIAEADAAAEGEAITSAPTPPARSRDRKELDWRKRWAPEPTMVEIGIYGGVLLPSPNHELFRPDLDQPAQGFKRLSVVSPDVGMRLGFYPGRFIGLEAEAGVMPSTLRDEDDPMQLYTDDPALLYTARGHLVLQLGLRSVTPFVLVGGGALGVMSNADVLGNDIDPEVHFGGGLKFYLNRYVMLRIDARDVVSYERGPDDVWASHSPEFLLGLSGTFGRKRDKPVRVPEPEPPSVTVPASASTSALRVASDRDGDGLLDSVDLCPNEAEIFNDYRDDDGCLESDRDGDGLFDDQDSCPDEVETANGYQDEDGCSDELPKEVQAFTGAIEGITFDNDEATIRRSSIKTLDSAVQVLMDNPDIRIKISGHTDNVGDREHNVDLSTRRAEAVKSYLTEHGILEDRITTEGFGPDKPVDPNETKAGRANNRRIEFEIMTGAK